MGCLPLLERSIMDNLLWPNPITASEFSKSNFYYLKGVTENLLNQLNILNIKYEVTNDELFELSEKIKSAFI